MLSVDRIHHPKESSYEGSTILAHGRPPLFTVVADMQSPERGQWTKKCSGWGLSPDFLRKVEVVQRFRSVRLM